MKGSRPDTLAPPPKDSLQAALIRFQQQQPSFEIGIAKSIQSACVLYDEAKKLQEAGIAQVEQEIALALQRVEPDAEVRRSLPPRGQYLTVSFRTVHICTS